MKINNKGFTLVELLAVVVILSVLMAIMVPSVSYIIKKNKEDSYSNLQKSIITAAKAYISDNRYDIKLSTNNVCVDDVTNILKIKNISLENSKLPISLLINMQYLSADSSGNIINPKDNNKKLDLNYNESDNRYSYVLVKYQCSTKDYTYTLESDSLVWEDK